LQGSLNRGFLRAQPGHEVVTLTTHVARPTPGPDGFAVFPERPVFLDDHQAPAAAACVVQSEGVDDEGMTVARKLKRNTFEAPVRVPEAGISRAEQQVEEAEE
jgi:hypothetical protein